jgi:hypothetical protein
MPSSTLHRGSFSWGGRLAVLWLGILTGPIAWAALLETNYAMSYLACEQRHTWMLHLATAVALALVGAAALLAWRAAPPVAGDPGGDEASVDPRETATVRARFMAVTGLALSAWFALVILSMEIPVLVLHPCTP